MAHTTSLMTEKPTSKNSLMSLLSIWPDGTNAKRRCDFNATIQLHASGPWANALADLRMVHSRKSGVSGPEGIAVGIRLKKNYCNIKPKPIRSKMCVTESSSFGKHRKWRIFRIGT